ncbi:MAG: HIT domain-containing protein [Proteobacteria bacterium]|nr:HIT domain-containing protein [Pseudomonadota bacterium]
MHQYDDTNIFARIIRGELSCNKVYEDEQVIAFHDIHKAAPVHVLVLPKGRYISFHDFTTTAAPQEVADFFTKVRVITEQLELVGSGYRLVANHGSDGSQTVPHFHVHILGKRRLGAIVSGDTYHERVQG